MSRKMFCRCLKRPENINPAVPAASRLGFARLGDFPRFCNLTARPGRAVRTPGVEHLVLAIACIGRPAPRILLPRLVGRRSARPCRIWPHIGRMKRRICHRRMGRLVHTAPLNCADGGGQGRDRTGDLPLFRRSCGLHQCFSAGQTGRKPSNRTGCSTRIGGLAPFWPHDAAGAKSVRHAPVSAQDCSVHYEPLSSLTPYQSERISREAS
jgi:hypothetical protein